MQPLIRCDVDGGVAVLAHSTRSDGDLSPSTVEAGELERRRSRAVPLPWFWARQVHSDRVVRVDADTDQAMVPVADALVTRRSHVALAVHAGDCVPVGLVSLAGAVAAVHAGWKGLEAGVLESAVRALRQTDPRAPIIAAVGPHIRAAHYEFGRHDLRRLSHRFDVDVAAETESGEPALDLSAAVGGELARLGVTVDTWSGDCTAQDADDYWSHRARQEPGRIALVAWLE